MNREEIISLLNNAHKAVDSIPCLSDVRNPSYSLIKKAIKKDPLNIMWVKDPPIKLKVLAIKLETHSIFLFENPEPVLIQAYIKYCEPTRLLTRLLKFNLTNKVLEQISGIFPDIFYYIKNPSEKIKRNLIKSNFWHITDICNPSEKLQMIAVKEDPQVIDCIRNPTRKVLQYCIDQKAMLSLSTLDVLPDDLLLKYYKSKLFKDIIE
jgi:hypothetical protein